MSLLWFRYRCTIQLCAVLGCGLLLLAASWLVLPRQWRLERLGDAQPAQLTSPATSEAWPRRWAPHEEAAVEAQVLTAFNCARSQQDLPPYQVDASLTAEAERLWMQLARQEISLKQAEAGYTLFGVIALDLSQPAQGCSIGGFDVAQVPALDRARVIGIAAFPPQISYDGASAVIIGK